MEDKEVADYIKPKNTIVQYQGGGYDGCIWEWNLAFFSGTGKFYDIFSSGYAGCRTEEEMLELLAKGPGDRSTKEFYLYDVTKRESLEELATETSVDLVYGLSKWFSGHPEFGVDILQQCTICKLFGSADDDGDFRRDGLSGDGGIAASHKENICRDCYDENNCSECGEYIWNKKWQARIREIIAAADNDNEKDLVCEWCCEKKEKLKMASLRLMLKDRDLSRLLNEYGAVLGRYVLSLKRVTADGGRIAELFYSCLDWNLSQELEMAKLAQESTDGSDAYLAVLDFRRKFSDEVNQ